MLENLKYLPFVFGLLLTGCNSIKISTEPAAGYVFNTISSYAWMPVQEETLQQENAILNRDMQKALNNQLHRHGWTEIQDPENADIHLSYYLTLEEHQQYSSNLDEEQMLSGGFTYDTETESWHAQTGGPDLNVYTVEIGTLHVMMHDADTGDCVWKGALETRIDRTQPPDKQYELFLTMARKMVTRLP